MNKRTGLIVVIVAILLLCCCSIVAIAGVTALLNSDEGGKTTTETTKETTKETTIEDENIVPEVRKPTLDDAWVSYDSLSSYRIEGTITTDGDVTTVTGAYNAPDEESFNLQEPLAVTEHIYVGDILFTRVQGGTWSVSEDPSNISFVKYAMNVTLYSQEGTILPEDTGAHWKFSHTNDWLYEIDTELLIEKDTYHPYKLTTSYLDVSGQRVEEEILFKDLNDPTIDIEIPDVN